jgi:hypothetical protein
MENREKWKRDNGRFGDGRRSLFPGTERRDEGVWMDTALSSLFPLTERRDEGFWWDEDVSDMDGHRSMEMIDG